MLEQDFPGQPITVLAIAGGAACDWERRELRDTFCPQYPGSEGSSCFACFTCFTKPSAHSTQAVGKLLLRFQLPHQTFRLLHQPTRFARPSGCFNTVLHNQCFTCVGDTCASPGLVLKHRCLLECQLHLHHA